MVAIQKNQQSLQHPEPLRPIVTNGTFGEKKALVPEPVKARHEGLVLLFSASHSGRDMFIISQIPSGYK